MAVLSRFFLVGTDFGVDTTGITDIELQSLDEILTGVADRDVDSDDDDDDDDSDDDDDEDGGLVCIVHDDVVAALAGADTTALRLVAIRWAQTDELIDSDADVLFDLVLELSTLAKQGIREQRAMRLRVQG